VPELQKITSEYLEHEDRVRLSGEVDAGSTEVLWLTQRLLILMIEHLSAWLEEQSGGSGSESARAEHTTEMLQGFAQQAASAELVPEQPVQQRSNSRAWLVNSVDITRGPEAIVLTFKGADGEEATLNLEAQHLRQWLGIVYSLWGLAGWPLAVWPQWMQRSESVDTSGSDIPFH
jgi:hypothetical protein